MVPAITRSRFGYKSLGKIYGFVSFAPMIASYVLAYALACGVYARQSSCSEHAPHHHPCLRLLHTLYVGENERQHPPPGDDGAMCVGPECFRATMYSLAALCAVATVAGAWLAREDWSRVTKAERRRRENTPRVRRQRSVTCLSTSHWADRMPSPCQCLS